MSRKQRALCWLLIVAAVAAGLWLLHAPTLRFFAGCLVADEPAGDYQYVGILDWYGGPDGDRCYDAARQLHRQKPARGILLVQSPPDRLVETGALPSFEAISRRGLGARGLPQQAISAISGKGRDDWAKARALRAWLLDRPDASIVVLCGRFRSAHLRYALDTVLDPRQSARVRLRALPDRQYDETNWWTSRTGIKAFGIEWLRRMHDWCVGGEHPPAPLHSADDYERNVVQTLSECAVEPAEYAMLLTGDENTRPFVAAALWKAGLARRVLVSEIAGSPLVEELILPPGHEINRRVLVKRGVPKSDVTILPASATTTYDEAQALTAFLRGRPKTARVLVVTSDYHMRRSRWVFVRVLAERTGQVSFVSAPTDEFRMDRWWQDEAGFVTILTEHFKFAFYFACYSHLGSWLAACGALALVATWILGGGNRRCNRAAGLVV